MAAAESSPPGRSRLLLLLLAATALRGAATEPVPHTLELSGVACDPGLPHDVEQGLNNRIFEIAGHTQSGAPYFVAAAAEGRAAYYMYWDPNCDSSNDRRARWIIDLHMPDLEAVQDLGSKCDYTARLISEDYEHPPLNSNWRVNCGEQYQEMELSFLQITSTSVTSTTTTTNTVSSTSTTTSSTITTTTLTVTETTTATTLTSTSTTLTATVTTKTATVTTQTTTATTVTVTSSEPPVAANATTNATTTEGPATEEPETTLGPNETLPPTTTTAVEESDGTTTVRGLRNFVFFGACEDLGYVNGVVFVEQGVTEGGEPWFKAASGADAYIYFDRDCAGDGRQARWILDPNQPDPTRLQDLDGDGDCLYQARLNAEPGSGLDGPPAEATWSMFCGGAWEDREITLLPPAERQAIAISGACEEKSSLDEAVFVRMNTTASGAPYYYAAGAAPYYIYFDPDCGGQGSSAPRWVIDIDAPDTAASADLDGDGACNYHARLYAEPAEALHGPPGSAVWSMYCGSEWEDVTLTITARERAGISTTARAGEISGCERCSRWHALLSLALLLPSLAAAASGP